MTPAEAVLAEAEAAGVQIFRVGDKLRLRAPGPPSDALRQRIREAKPDLLLLVPELPGPSVAWTADPSALRWNPLGEDPRPDLEGSELWARLLQLASGDAADPYGVYGRLLGARACGAVLERRGKGWRLVPTVDPSERLSVWADQAAWDADAERWLRPRAAEITALLRHLPPFGGEVGVPR